MGHTWAEMFPAEAEAQSRRWDAIWKLRDQLKKMPLSAFMASDFGAIGRVNGDIGNKSLDDPTKEDMKLLRKRIAAWKKVNKSS